MFGVEQFDQWALDYEREALEIEAHGGYPFEGRLAVLDEVLKRACAAGSGKVCDLGCGPGILLERIADAGCKPYGVDSSAQMLALAEKRVASAKLSLADIREPLPEEWGSDFAAFTCTYAIHHIPDEDKVALIRSLLSRLVPGGAVLIGDVAFATVADREAARAAAGEDWDDDEFYSVAEVLAPELPGLSFTRISPVAGIIEVRA